MFNKFKALNNQHRGNVSAPGIFLDPCPQWPFRGCTKGAHLAQCSYLGAWLY